MDSQHVRSVFGPLLADPGRSVVACDYDGTLAPIAPTPAQALPAVGAVEALAALSPLVGRLAVVTGRPAADVVELGRLDRVDGLVVLGSYGAQRWEGGLVHGPSTPLGVVAARAELTRMLADGLGGAAAVGAWIEDKHGSFGLHLRAAAEPLDALAAVRGPVEELAVAHGLVVEQGRLVLELRPGGVDKGTALRGLVDELAEEVRAPVAAVLFIGDDLGDLAAFDATRELRAGGASTWSVASASTEAPEVSAAADLTVDGPAGVVNLLADLVVLLSG